MISRFIEGRLQSRGPSVHRYDAPLKWNRHNAPLQKYQLRFALIPANHDEVTFKGVNERIASSGWSDSTPPRTLRSTRGVGRFFRGVRWHSTRTSDLRKLHQATNKQKTDFHHRLLSSCRHEHGVPEFGSIQISRKLYLSGNENLRSDLLVL